MPSKFISLDKKLAFLDVGNLEDRTKFSTHSICLHNSALAILNQISVENVTKCHVLVSRACWNSNFWPSEYLLLF